MQRISHPDGIPETFTYNVSGRVLSHTDGKGQTTRLMQMISYMERDALHREVYRTQGKLASCFGYDAMGRKAWQFASTLPADKLSQVHNTGINTLLLVEHAYNPIHRRYQYDPAGNWCVPSTSYAARSSTTRKPTASCAVVIPAR
ncbi:hypothetical protein BGP81_08305 [Pseudomonas putida]|nr:hypothetical protein BGP81_08305 [Pseudomonas putida]